jgi:single-stranded-DNA-specific exonuclease
LVQPNWHPGVLGIVANRLAEQYRRPTGLLTITAEGLARGSLRSVPGVDLGAVLAAHTDLLVRFGGHAGAAGLTVDPLRIPELRRVLSNTIEATRVPEIDAGALAVDAVVSLGDLSLELAQALNRLAPFGEGNPPVTLVSHGVTVQASRLIGRNRRHRKLGLADEQGVRREAVWWGGADAELPEGVLDVAYTLGQNEFRGEVSLQLSVQAVRLQAPVVVAAAAPSAIAVIDLRTAADPLAEVRHLLAGPDSWQVWAEGQVPSDIPTRTRHTLIAQAGLIVWSAPPSRHELARAMQRAAPGQVAFVNQVTTSDRLDSFLRDLLGMVKFALARRKGELHIPAMAAGLGQREVTVRRGLAWLEANGRMQIVSWLTGDRLLVAAGPEAESQPAGLVLAQAELHALLAEAAAFRAFCHRAPAESLLEDT